MGLLRIHDILVLFVHMRDRMSTVSVPSFAGAAYQATMNYSRFKSMLLSALLVQVRIQHGAGMLNVQVQVLDSCLAY